MLNYDIQSGELSDKLSNQESITKDLNFNPFPGLRPFSLDECHLFFGREGQVDEVLVKLSQNRFITIMGHSGSGKSSLMYCGLIPILYGGFMTQAGPNWNIITTRPGVSPIENLANSLIHSDPSYASMTAEERLINKTIVTSLLRGNENALVEIVEKQFDNSGENTLILIDQFEELFRHQQNAELHDDTRLYINALLAACRNTKVPIYLAITMRSDYIGACGQFAGLTQLINQSNYLIPQMTREQRRVAIEGPVAVGGGRISNRLVKRLINEVGDNQDQLPILQHALMRTWDYWVLNRDEFEPIDIRHYNAIGKISEALSQHANEAFDELSNDEKNIAEVLFKALTEKTSENYGLRRPAKLRHIAELAQVNEEDVIKVIDKFRQTGRSFLMPSAHVILHSDSIIEISHESLMRIWIRLKSWVDEEYESAQIYKRLSEAAALYQIGRTGLWRPPDLQMALEWQKKQKPTRAWAHRYDEAFERAIVFLDTSRITYEAEQRNQEMLQNRLLKRTKIVAIVLGIAAIIATIFFIYGVTQNIQAERNLQLAKQEQRKAEKSADDALAQKEIADEQKQIALEETERAKKATLRMQEAFKDLSIQKGIADERFIFANEQMNIAENQKNKAQEATVEKNKQFERAENNLVSANKLLYQQVAQSMAVKSLSIEDSNLKGLLAQQAYVFHTRYDGRTYDPYIYDGLYYAASQLQGKKFSTLAVKHRNAVRSLVIESNSDNFYTTGTAGNVKLASFGQSKVNNTLFSNNYPNRILALSPNDQWLITGSDSSALQVYNVNSKILSKINGHSSYINDIDFINNNEFISIAGDRQIRINNIETNKSDLLITTSTELKVIDISQNAKYLAGGSINGQVVLMNLSNNELETIIDIPQNPVHAVKFSPDGKWLAIGDEKGTVKIWSIVERQVIKEFTQHKGRISDLEFSDDGKLLASGSFDRTINLWNTNKLDELPIRISDNNSYIWDIAFSRDSNYLLASCGDGEIRKWPTNPSIIAKDICEYLTKNMTEEEWNTYVGNNIKFENTCMTLLLEDY